MGCAFITQVHFLDDELFESVFSGESPVNIASTVSACILQAKNTGDEKRAEEITALICGLCCFNEAGDDIIEMARRIQELRNTKNAKVARK